MSTGAKPSEYHGYIPDAAEFEVLRDQWRDQLGGDQALLSRGTELFLDSTRYMYNFQWEWCGVPVIRTPEDMCVLQEIVWHAKPAGMIEVGVARGGGVILSASLMASAGLPPRVLGIDIAILEHTQQAIMRSPWAQSIELLEASSTSEEAASAVQGFVAEQPGVPVILTLDSNHSHAHVLEELRSLTPWLPVGSWIVVADMVIEDSPTKLLEGRPWGPGNSPASAVKAFLAEEGTGVVRDARWGRRALITECRDGYLRRVAAS